MEILQRTTNSDYLTPILQPMEIGCRKPRDWCVKYLSPATSWSMPRALRWPPIQTTPLRRRWFSNTYDMRQPTSCSGVGAGCQWGAPGRAVQRVFRRHPQGCEAGPAAQVIPNLEAELGGISPDTVIDELIEQVPETRGDMAFLDRFFRWGRNKQTEPSKLFQNSDDEPDIDDAFLGRLRRVTLASQRRLTSGVTGEHASPRRANALEFADYRNYAPGDDFRRVDWNAYLRLGQLFVKLADAPERMTLHLLLDSSQSMAWGKPEKFSYARRIAIGLAYVALAHMDAANLLVLSDRDCRRLTQMESTSATAAMVRTSTRRAVGGRPERRIGQLPAWGAIGVAVLITIFFPTGYQQGLERVRASSGLWSSTRWQS